MRWFSQRAGRGERRDGRLLVTFEHTSLGQVTGLVGGERDAVECATLCRLFDEEPSADPSARIGAERRLPWRVIEAVGARDPELAEDLERRRGRR